MSKFVVLLLGVGSGVALRPIFDAVGNAVAVGGGQDGGNPNCTSQNGDVNADGSVNLSDAVTTLNHLFLGKPTMLAPLCTTPAHFALLDSGQNTCYDEAGNVVDCASNNCAGQDGFYVTGCPMEGRFVDNADGTVTDNCTRLMWQKATGNDGKTLAWCSSLAYCEKLVFAGHDDWRFPSITELLSIVDFGRFSPAMDPAFSTVRGFHYSSTTFANEPESAWGVDSVDGYQASANKIADFYVRAVRDIQ